MNWQAIATLSVGRTLNWVLVGISIGLFAEMVLRIAKRHNSGTRFAVWFSALLGIAIVPVAIYMPSRADSAAGVAPSGIVLPESWALYLLASWITLTTLGLMRLGVGLWQVRRLRRSSVEIPLSSLYPLLRRRLLEHRGRHFLLYRNDTLRVPMAVGFLPAAIILPSWTLTELSPAELDAVVLHELAHIERWDDWTNLAQRFIAAILFFHPAVWWISSRLTLEREMACDDLVLKETSNPRGYAHCLVSIAEKSFLRRGFCLAQAAVTRMRQTARRISQILDVNRPAATTVWKPALGLVASFSLLSVFVVSRTPQLIAFEGNTVQAKDTPQIPSLQQRSSTPQAPNSRTTNGASVIAASMRRSRTAVPRASTASGSPRRALAHATRFVNKSASPAAIQLATARDRNPQSKMARSDAYFVVLQTQYSPSGEALWTIRVVQLTVFHPNSAQAQQDFPPKSI